MKGSAQIPLSVWRKASSVMAYWTVLIAVMRGSDAWLVCVMLTMEDVPRSAMNYQKVRTNKGSKFDENSNNGSNFINASIKM